MVTPGQLAFQHFAQQLGLPEHADEAAIVAEIHRTKPLSAIAAALGLPLQRW